MTVSNTPSPCILFAEDNPDDAHLIRLELDQAGIRNPVVIVEDGEAVLRYLRRDRPFQDAAPPGLVVLDLHLPLVEGADIVTHMARDGKTDVPVVIMSSPTELPWVEEQMGDVIAGMLPKPIDAQALGDVVAGIEGLGPVFLDRS